MSTCETCNTSHRPCWCFDCGQDHIQSPLDQEPSSDAVQGSKDKRTGSARYWGKARDLTGG